MTAPITPKYRMLTPEEFESLRQEFIYYLASLGVSADQWKKIRETQPVRMTETLTGFSDFILEQVYCKCRLVEEVTPNGWLFYHFNDQSAQVELLGIVTERTDELDFRQLTSSEILDRLKKENSPSLSIIRATKAQQPDKAAEIHQMLQRGAFISRDLEMYEQINVLTKDN